MLVGTVRFGRKCCQGRPALARITLQLASLYRFRRLSTLHPVLVPAPRGSLPGGMPSLADALVGDAVDHLCLYLPAPAVVSLGGACRAPKG